MSTPSTAHRKYTIRRDDDKWSVWYCFDPDNTKVFTLHSFDSWMKLLQQNQLVYSIDQDSLLHDLAEMESFLDDVHIIVASAAEVILQKRIMNKDYGKNEAKCFLKEILLLFRQFIITSKLAKFLEKKSLQHVF